ncbi:MAG: NUDIX domain-containing protein [Candidatus Peregrinibacteria bacterium]|nr:NUDIX domain-containing protein [Candidatus Peregrinibacteria bacterium]
MPKPSLSLVSGLESVRIQNQEKFDALEKIDGVVIVGSTCAGKSVVVDAIRQSYLALQGIIDVPKRYITRPQRAKDNIVENAFVTPEEFQTKVDGDEIGLHWIRKMEGDREERYGFHRTTGDALPVYSGNNALYNNSESVRPEGVLKNALMLGVYAPDDVRRERLVSRSPDLLKDRPEEVAYRLGDSSENMLPHIHVLVDNHGQHEQASRAEVMRLIERIVCVRRNLITALDKPVEQYRGRLIRIATQRMGFPDASEKSFEFAERAPGVRILVTDGKRILLTKEWRSETQNWDHRLPGGKVFDTLEEYLVEKDKGDEHLQAWALAAARKELSEETSLQMPADSFRHIGRSVAGATVVWDLHYYLVETAKQEGTLPGITTGEGEQTHPEWFTYEQVKSLCVEGHVQEDRTVAFLLRHLLAKEGK